MALPLMALPLMALPLMALHLMARLEALVVEQYGRVAGGDLTAARGRWSKANENPQSSSAATVAVGGASLSGDRPPRSCRSRAAPGNVEKRRALCSCALLRLRSRKQRAEKRRSVDRQPVVGTVRQSRRHAPDTRHTRAPRGACDLLRAGSGGATSQ